MGIMEKKMETIGIIEYISWPFSRSCAQKGEAHLIVPEMRSRLCDLGIGLD